MGTNNSHSFITIPAAARAMDVSRIVVERAIKSKQLPVHAFMTGSKGAGFRLLSVDDFRKWLTDRKGYHESLRGGATKFHAWGARVNPDVITAKAVAITAGK